MKRVSGIFILLLCILALSACQMPKLSLADFPLIKNFQCDLSVKTSDKEYYCHFTRNDDMAEIEVIQPERIEGLTLIYENDIYSVSFKGITVSLDDSKNQYIKYFADGFIENLEEIFNSEESKPKYEGSRIFYEGSSEYGDYTIYFDAQGRLMSMEIPSIETVITAENFKF